MTRQRHIYFIGIGGSGTVWLADYALAHGWRVSGSDLTESAITRRLVEDGAAVTIGVDAAAIPDDITDAVINSAITPSSPSYPELMELRRRKVPVVKRAQFAGEITRRHTTIAVAGTHGKTTTTAMVGWILEKAGYDPTVFVGGSIREWGNRTRIGKSTYLVIEADEFDRSFHSFTADIAILLNVQEDHLDYYKGGIEEIEHSYRRFLRNLPYRTGIVVGYGRDKHIRKVCKGFSYAFRWYDETKLWPGLKLPQPGLHMRLNATAAAKAAHELGVPSKIIKAALATFPGTGRRFDYHGKWHAVEVYDDYAHHPQEIMATLQAIREKFPTDQVTVVFQPHQKSRTKLLLKEFGRAFDRNAPDRLILAPIYEVPGREEEIAVRSADIATEIGRRPDAVRQCEVALDNDDLERLVRTAIEQPGILVCMGAGSISGMLERWLER